MLISNFFINQLMKKIRLLNMHTDDDMSKIKYSLQVILWELEKIMILCIIFSLLGSLDYFILTFIILISIRQHAGGYHATTSLNCLLLTFCMFYVAIFLLPQIQLQSIGIGFISCISFITNFLLAPITSIQRPKISNEKRRFRKIISSIMILIWTLLIFYYADNTYAMPVLWIIFLQNMQLMLEYLRRKLKLS